MIVMKAKAILQTCFLILHSRGSKCSNSGALSWMTTGIDGDVADYLAGQWSRKCRTGRTCSSGFVKLLLLITNCAFLDLSCKRGMLINAIDALPLPDRSLRHRPLDDKPSYPAASVTFLPAFVTGGSSMKSGTSSCMKLGSASLPPNSRSRSTSAPNASSSASSSASSTSSGIS